MTAKIIPFPCREERMRRLYKKEGYQEDVIAEIYYYGDVPAGDFQHRLNEFLESLRVDDPIQT